MPLIQSGPCTCLVINGLFICCQSPVFSWDHMVHMLLTSVGAIGAWFVFSIGFCGNVFLFRGLEVFFSESWIGQWVGGTLGSWILTK